MSTYKREWSCCGSVTYTDAWAPEQCPFCEPDKAELDRLHARVAELEADAERLDWLFENYSSLLCTHQGMAPKVTFQPCLLNKDFAPAMLRAAIDTARKAKPGGKTNE